MNEAGRKKAHRAGQYIKQPLGFRAFIPAKLPPTPPVRLDGDISNLLSEADRALGRLDGSLQTLPNPDLFVFMYVRKEAVLSSQIEGTQSSLNDVLAAEAKILSPEQPKDVGEVINYVRAMNHGLTRLNELPLSIRLIKEIHAHLMSGVRGSHLTPGEFRRSQNWIGPAGCNLNDAVFVPPPVEDIAPALGDLETFLHEERALPDLIVIGLAHAQFETIHPFLDGNGRVGRLLITFLLCHRKILGKPGLYLSHFFKKHRSEYYERLQAVRDHGDWESWLAFFLRGVREVSEEAAVMARKILAMREEHRALVTMKLGRGAGKGHRLLDYLYQRPIVSVAQVKELTEVTFPAANTLVSRMREMGILQEITGNKRARLFRYDAYVNLFGS